MHFPLDTFHTPIVQSSDPDAKYSPFGENITLKTYNECPVRVFISSPLDTLHIVISLDPDARYSPFGENTRLKTGGKCPVRVFIRSPLDTLHTPITPF